MQSGRALRVAMFIHSLEEGGAQRRTLTLAGLLGARGIDVRLVVVSDRGPLRPLVPPGVEVNVIGGRLARLPWFKNRRVRQVNAAIPALALYLRRERPDVLCAAANHTALAASMAHWISGCADVALVFRVSNALVSRPRKRQAMRNKAMRAALRRVDAVAALSNALAGEVEALCSSPRPEIRTVVNPVIDLQRMDAAQEGAARKVSRRVVSLGRAVPQKDFATLIHAFALLPPDLGAQLVILGDGPERERLGELSVRLGRAGSVTLPGHVLDPIPCLREADLFVLSSAWEGLPGTLIEAMACGCAVISTDIPGAREVLLDGTLAPLVPVGDAAAMAREIEKALRTPPDTTALVRRSHDFSYESAATQFLDVLMLAHERRKAARAAARVTG